MVDFVAKEAAVAGVSAANYLSHKNVEDSKFILTAKSGIGYILPQSAHYHAKNIELKTRVKKPMKKATIVFESNGKVIKQINKVNLFPAEMLDINITEDVIKQVKNEMKVSVIESE